MVRLAAVRPCKGSSGTEVLPEGKLDLGMDASANCLRQAGLDVTNAKVLLIVRGSPQVTLYPSGRMLVHTNDLDRAKERAVQVLTLLVVD
ncbi:MAG: hypothetical protein LN414_03745 [Candidatus Thermoplasmatota archaeon]|nr:hypothetical protein [Candidatus Thermoplasmatota archaeon]